MVTSTDILLPLEMVIPVTSNRYASDAPLPGGASARIALFLLSFLLGLAGCGPATLAPRSFAALPIRSTAVFGSAQGAAVGFWSGKRGFVAVAEKAGGYTLWTLGQGGAAAKFAAVELPPRPLTPVLAGAPMPPEMSRLVGATPRCSFQHGSIFDNDRVTAVREAAGQVAVLVAHTDVVQFDGVTTRGRCSADATTERSSLLLLDGEGALSRKVEVPGLFASRLVHDGRRWVGLGVVHRVSVDPADGVEVRQKVAFLFDGNSGEATEVAGSACSAGENCEFGLSGRGVLRLREDRGGSTSLRIWDLDGQARGTERPLETGVIDSTPWPAGDILAWPGGGFLVGLQASSGTSWDAPKDHWVGVIGPEGAWVVPPVRVVGSYPQETAAGLMRVTDHKASQFLDRSGRPGPVFRLPDARDLDGDRGRCTWILTGGPPSVTAVLACTKSTGPDARPVYRLTTELVRFAPRSG